ncbi:MAG: hypothetical protein QN229_02875 [Desulfurococcaceae archaeon TW002]
MGPGILLTLKLYKPDVKKEEFVDVTPTIFNNPDVLMYLEIDAVTLPSFKWKKDKVTIIKTTAKPKETFNLMSYSKSRKSGFLNMIREVEMLRKLIPA